MNTSKMTGYVVCIQDAEAILEAQTVHEPSLARMVHGAIVTFLPGLGTSSFFFCFPVSVHVPFLVVYRVDPMRAGQCG